MKHTEQFISEVEASEQDARAADYWQNQQDTDDFADTLPGGATALSFFEKGLTKSELRAMAASAVDSVLEKGNPLQVAESLSAMECFIKEVKDNKKFKDYVREEAVKTPKGFVSNSGAKIEVCETGTSYDFSSCGDAVLCQYENELEEAKIKVDERKTFLKTLPASGLDTVTPDFEIIKIFPPAKSSTSSYKITLAK